MSEAIEPKYRQRVAYQAMLLGGFTALASIFLVSSNLATRDAIALRQQEDLLASINQVVPAHYYDNDLLDSPINITITPDEIVTVYRGLKNSKVSAVAYEISEPGYSGDIKLIIGLDASGNILGTRVLSHTETPGLGDKIEEKKDDWILGFNGLSISNPTASRWKVKKDGGQFDAFSGATITPRAVVKAIKKGLDFFKSQQAVLLEPPKLEPKLLPEAPPNGK